jgi:hypothetical protein
LRQCEHVVFAYKTLLPLLVDRGAKVSFSLLEVIIQRRFSLGFKELCKYFPVETMDPKVSYLICNYGAKSLFQFQIERKAPFSERVFGTPFISRGSPEKMNLLLANCFTLNLPLLEKILARKQTYPDVEMFGIPYDAALFQTCTRAGHFPYPIHKFKGLDPGAEIFVECALGGSKSRLNKLYKKFQIEPTTEHLRLICKARGKNSMAIKWLIEEKKVVPDLGCIKAMAPVYSIAATLALVIRKAQ